MTNTNIKNWCLAFALAAATPAAFAAAETEAPVAAAQQTADCTGVVLDSDGEPLPGASVKVVGTVNGGSTNIDGEFTLKGVAKGAKITVSYVGYKPQTVVWNGTPLTITMSDDDSVLGEVVVMGYGVEQKRANVTNSIAKVSEKTLTVGTNANPAQALVGAISGVRVSVTTGDPSATPSITIRGGTNFDGASNEPLVVVDGNIRNSLSDINSNDIADMQILKDAGATALYGARAGNGVILITTKQGQAGKGSVTFSGKVGLAYYNNGYDPVSDEDFLYYYRTSCYNTEWMRPGGTYAGNYNTMLFGNNQPGAIGRKAWANNMNYNILEKNDNTKYLIEQGIGGWKEMLDPVSDAYILYWNQDVMKLNTQNPAVTQDYNLSFSGGNDRGRYYASLGYYDADGTLNGLYYKRYNFSLTGEYKITNWLTSNSVFTYVRAENVNTNPQLGIGPNDDGAYGVVGFMNRAFMYKFVRYYDEEGNNLFGTGSPTLNVNTNLDNFVRKPQNDKFSMTQSFTAKIIDGLTLKGTMSWFYNENYNNNYNKKYITNQNGAIDPDGTNGVDRNYSTSSSFNRTFDQTYNLVANFNRTFKEKHAVQAMLGAEYHTSKYTGFSASGSGAPAPFPNLGLTQNTAENPTRSMSSFINEEALLSYFGRAEYIYDNRYILAATFREDGYSRLVNKRWGFFPGVSAGWNFYNEQFWKELPISNVISYGKIRGSYGTNAIINTNKLGYYTLQGQYGSFQYDGNIGYRISSLPNPDLRWEKAKTGEVGIDLGFWQNRLNFGMTYYNRTTVDKYAPLSLPQTTGFSSVTYNNGSYRNEGLELDLSTTILRTRDFQWTFGANLTYNTNKIIKLPDNGLPNNRQGGVEVYTGNGDETYYIGGQQEGQNPYQHVGFGTRGIARNQAAIDALGDYIDVSGSFGIYANESGRQRLLQLGYANNGIVRLMPGDIIFEDRNGDNTIDNKDQKLIGHGDVKWSGGFNTTLSWKGLSLYARFDMGWGFQVYDSNMGFWLGEGQGAMSFPTQALDSWTADNPNAKWPRIAWASQYGTMNYTRTSDLFAQNGAYLACRELSLSYQLPASICSKFKSQGLTLSITGQNLGYIKSCTNPLPDRTYTWGIGNAGHGGTWNMPRNVIFGLNVTF